MNPRTMNAEYLKRMNGCFEYLRIYFIRVAKEREREIEARDGKRERERPIY